MYSFPAFVHTDCYKWQLSFEGAIFFTIFIFSEVFMFQYIFLGFVGLCSGVIIAGGITGLLMGLSIVPRYAGITRTADHILLYEDLALLGTVTGNLFYLFRWKLPLGSPFLILYGIFSGIFLGGWIMALAEMADVFPIFTRRIRFQKWLSIVVLCVALGKATGSLIY